MIGCKRYEQHYEQRSRRCHKMATLVKYSVLTPGAGRCHRPGRLYADTAYMAWRIGESDENGEFVGRAGGCRCAGGLRWAAPGTGSGHGRWFKHGDRKSTR